MGLGVPRWWFTVAIPPLCLAIAVAARAAAPGVAHPPRAAAPGDDESPQADAMIALAAVRACSSG